MIYHATSVVRAINRALVVVDLPFGSYQSDPKEALRSAIRIMKESGGHAVKLEGGKEIKEHIRTQNFRKTPKALQSLYSTKLRLEFSPSRGLGPWCWSRC